MQIRPDEITSVEDIGLLDGTPVRLLRSTGGFYFAMGKQKGKKLEEALAAGSHPGIVKYNVEKLYKEFIPALAKSDKDHVEVIGYTELLPTELRKSGYEMFMIEDLTSVSFTLTKNGMEKGCFKGNYSSDSLMLSKLGNIDKSLALPFAKATASAAARKALCEGKKFVQFEGVKVDSSKILKS